MSDLAARLSRLTPEQRLLLEKRLAGKAAGAGRESGMGRRPAGEPAVLSFSQRRLWYLEQLNPGTATYNAPYAFRGRSLTGAGALEVAALRRAVGVVVERHTVLRTRIGISPSGEAACTVAETWDGFEVRDLAAMPPGEAEAEGLRLAEAAAQRPFRLGTEDMVRVLVVLLLAGEFLLLVTAHHIAWDGVSKGIFFTEVGAAYAALVRGQEPGLAPLALEYADFAAWQQKMYTGAVREADAQYWRVQLEGAAPYLDLPLDRSRPAVQRFAGAKILFELGPGLIEAAQALSRAERTTLYATLLAAFKVFLVAFTGQADLSLATPFAGRDEPETQALIGFFTNTVVLRSVLDAGESYRAAIAKVRESLLGAQEHQRMPMDELVELLKRPRDLSRMPLAQVNFRLQGGRPPELRLEGVTLEPLPLIDTAISKFDLALELASVDGESGYLEYSTDLFEESRMAKIPAAFEALLRELLAKPGEPVAGLAAFGAVAELRPKRRRLEPRGLGAARAAEGSRVHA